MHTKERATPIDSDVGAVQGRELDPFAVHYIDLACYIDGAKSVVIRRDVANASEFTAGKGCCITARIEVVVIEVICGVVVRRICVGGKGVIVRVKVAVRKTIPRVDRLCSRHKSVSSPGR